MGSAEMHLERQGKPQLACEVCGGHFTPKRASWAKFCSTRCRNAHHAAEARVEKIKERAMPMFDALHLLAARGCTCVTALPSCPGCIAYAAIKDLKPPVEPKALLEKAKP